MIEEQNELISNSLMNSPEEELKEFAAYICGFKESFDLPNEFLISLKEYYQNGDTTVKKMIEESILKKLSEPRYRKDFDVEFDLIDIKIFFFRIREQKINSLFIEAYNFEDLERWVTFCEELKNLPIHITSLNLIGIDFKTLTSDKQKGEAFCEALKVLKITSLRLECATFGDLILQESVAFGKILKEALKNSGITIASVDLSVYGLIGLTFEGWASIDEILRSLSSTTVHLADIKIASLTFETWLKLGEILKNSGITSLSLSSNNLGNVIPEAWRVFGEMLKNSDITSLNLSRNNLESLTPEAWEAFCEMLKNSPITSLNLEFNDLSSKMNMVDKLQKFYDGLENSKITRLSIVRNNNLNDDVIEEIKSIIYKNLSLKDGGLKNLCLYTLFGLPGARLEKTEEGTFFNADNLEEPVPLEPEIADLVSAGKGLGLN